MSLGKHFCCRNSSKWAFQVKFVFAFVLGANLLVLTIGTTSPNKEKAEAEGEGAHAHRDENKAGQQSEQQGLNSDR